VEKKNIVLYSLSTCPHCKKAKAFLEEAQLPYQNFDVGDDKKARDEMVKKSGQMSVPVFDIEGQIIVGFMETPLKEALGI
jgi:glutaredoxin-like YruB-family protein